MKTKIILLGFTGLLALLFTSCEQLGESVVPSGNVSTQSRVVADFDGINVSDAFNVNVIIGEQSEMVRIESNDNLHTYIKAEVIGSTLHIGLNKNLNIRRGSATFNAYISADKLQDIEASGASNITLQNLLSSGNCYIELAGASRLEGNIEISQLIADISGASNLELSGTIRTMEFDASNASVLTDYDLRIGTFDADLSGASNAYVTVSNELMISASGASNVYYKGEGIVRRRKLSGASNIQHTN